MGTAVGVGVGIDVAVAVGDEVVVGTAVAVVVGAVVAGGSDVLGEDGAAVRAAGRVFSCCCLFSPGLAQPKSRASTKKKAKRVRIYIPTTQKLHVTFAIIQAKLLSN
jgi:hypothetical protein